MINLLKFLLKRQRKRSKLAYTNTGFTLIELLVGLVLASLVVTPLMGFMINIMDNENKEKAKATSEQEIQAAIDFIAEDLKQAIYIYDPSGLDKTSSDTPPGIKDQIPPTERAKVPGCRPETPMCVPVLVFWKRELRPNVLKLTSSSNCPPPPSATANDCDDVYVYSLVAYYLVKGEISSGGWSDAARIARFQIRDGFINPTILNNKEEPNNGFKLFDLAATGVNLTEKMNRWTKNNDVPYDIVATARVLVDFIDQSPISTSTLPSCPTGTQRVPSTTAFPTNLPGFFYVCVNSSNTSVQVFIRGNALARLEKNTIYSANKSIYFPTASIQVKGLGLLGIE